MSETRKRLTLQPPRNENVASAMDEVRNWLIEVGEALENILPPGREQALALTNLEQVCFWSIGAIARNQEYFS